jgi:hypothetical protein
MPPIVCRHATVFIRGGANHRRKKERAGSEDPALPVLQRLRCYLSQTGSPSPALDFVGFVVPTATPQVMPGICGWVTVADQYEVLGEIAGVPTPDVEANLPDSSASVP